jgi:hypothetical protein
MEYIPLNKLPNKYPDISNYMWEDGNYIVLEGEYDSNYIAFRKPFLSQLKWVTGTDFKFIVGLKTSDTDPYQQFYTSEGYYKLLEKSLLDNNPYFPKISFRKEHIITINIKDALYLFGSKNPVDERNNGVQMYRNFFCDADKQYFNNVDYNALVNYIQWVTKKSEPYDVDQGGVLPASLNSKYSILKYNPDLAIYQTEQEYDYFYAVLQLDTMIKLCEAAIAEFKACYNNPTQESIDSASQYVSSLAFGGAALGGAALVGAFASVGVAATTIAGTVTIVTSAGLVSVPAAAVPAALASLQSAGITIGFISSTGTTTAAVAGTAGVKTATATAPAGPIVAAIAVAIVIIATFIFGSSAKKEAERKRDEALAQVRQYCLTNISALEKDLDNYKKLLQALVDGNSNKTKVTNSSTTADGTPIPVKDNFVYDDSRIQTNIRRNFTLRA